MSSPVVTVVVPSYEQGRFLGRALASIVEQAIPMELFVLDAGSSDESIDVIHEWESHITSWRSRPDGGQAAAINEGIAQGSAPYVCWVNSDDWLLPGALVKMVAALESSGAAFAYGRAYNGMQDAQHSPVWVEPFDVERLATRCIIAQPATLIKRAAWEAVGGLDTALKMAMDYDLWWRLYKEFGAPEFVDDFLAVNRLHGMTKTRRFRREHYREAISIVRRHHGSVPWKWWLLQPYAVWWRSLFK